MLGSKELCESPLLLLLINVMFIQTPYGQTKSISLARLSRTIRQCYSLFMH